MAHSVYLILYVRDQSTSAAFYTTVLESTPIIDVPGITEFEISSSTVLAVMPEAGVRKLLGKALPDPAAAAGVPRAEVYLMVDDPASHHARAIAAGARELRPLAPADWGHDVAYSLDPDGHVLAFARMASDRAGTAG